MGPVRGGRVSGVALAESARRGVVTGVTWSSDRAGPVVIVWGVWAGDIRGTGLLLHRPVIYHIIPDHPPIRIFSFPGLPALPANVNTCPISASCLLYNSQP